MQGTQRENDERHSQSQGIIPLTLLNSKKRNDQNCMGYEKSAKEKANTPALRMRLEGRRDQIQKQTKTMKGL